MMEIHGNHRYLQEQQAFLQKEDFDYLAVDR